MRTFYHVFGAVIASAYVAAQPARAQHCTAPKNQIFYSTGTTAVALVEGSKEIKVLSIVCSNTDPSTSYNVHFSIVRESGTFPLVTIMVPAGAGDTVGKAPKAVVTPANIPGLPIDAERNPYLVLDLSDTLQMAADTAVSNGKRISCIAIACMPLAQ
jgi:hypothetical protein